MYQCCLKFFLHFHLHGRWLQCLHHGLMQFRAINISRLIYLGLTMISIQSSVLSPDSSNYCLRVALYRFGKSWCMQKFTVCMYFHSIAAFLGRDDGLMGEGWKPDLWCQLQCSWEYFCAPDQTSVDALCVHCPPMLMCCVELLRNEGPSSYYPQRDHLLHLHFELCSSLPLILPTSRAAGICDSDPGQKHDVVHDAHINLRVICVLIIIP